MHHLLTTFLNVEYLIIFEFDFLLACFLHNLWRIQKNYYNKSTVNSNQNETFCLFKKQIIDNTLLSGKRNGQQSN